MSKQFLKFCDIEIEEQKFHSSKCAVDIDDVNIKEILVSDAFAYSINKKQSLSFLSDLKIVDIAYLVLIGFFVCFFVFLNLLQPYTKTSLCLARSDSKY